MVTEIWLFLHKIGHYLPCRPKNAGAAEFKGDAHQVISPFVIFAAFDACDPCQYGVNFCFVHL